MVTNRNMWRGKPINGAIATLYLLLCLLALVGAATAETRPYVSNLRVGEHPGSTRLVLELSGRVAYKIFTLADPYRVVIDFPEVAWRVPRGRMQTARGVISQLRFGLFQPGNSRVVVDMSAPAVIAGHFVIAATNNKPVRLVLDLKPVSRTAFLAAPRVVRSPGWKKTARRKAPALDRPPAAKNGRRVIIIDPGHGGVDPGTIGVSGTYEKRVTLAVAKTAKRILEASGRYRVVLTRNRDIYVRLRDRFEIAHQNNAELFLSLHADSIPNKKIRGGSIYTLSDKASDKEAEDLAHKENKSDIIAGADLTGYAPEVSRVLIDLAQNDTNRESWHFARNLVAELKKEIRMLRTSHRYAGFAVLKSPNVPSALIELGYLSNRIDERNLGDAAYRKRVGRALLRAIDRYFRRKDQNSRS